MLGVEDLDILVRFSFFVPFLCTKIAHIHARGFRFCHMQIWGDDDTDDLRFLPLQMVSLRLGLDMFHFMLASGLVHE